MSDSSPQRVLKRTFVDHSGSLDEALADIGGNLDRLALEQRVVLRLIAINRSGQSRALRVSEWAFWFMVATYLLWIGVNRFHDTKRIRPLLMLTIVLIMAAIVGLFVGIPIVSNFAFWFVAAAYVIIVASTDIIRRD